MVWFLLQTNPRMDWFRRLLSKFRKLPFLHHSQISSLSFHHPRATKGKKKKILYLKHISGGKDHRNGFVFLSWCILRAFQSRLYIFFDRKNSFSCWGQCRHSRQSVYGLGSRNNRALSAKPWKQIVCYRQHFGRESIIPLFMLRPQATLVGLLPTEYAWWEVTARKRGIAPNEPGPNHHRRPPDCTQSKSQPGGVFQSLSWLQEQFKMD